MDGRTDRETMHVQQLNAVPREGRVVNYEIFCIVFISTTKI